MNTCIHHSSSYRGRSGQAGTTLLEVLLAMVIFAVGMLALASLQSNLTRSNSDANMRTVAANIAEETIEDLRAFEVIDTTAGKKAYKDIVSKSTTLPPRGGVVYTVTTLVSDYYFGADRVSVSKTPPSGVTDSDFKQVEITVTWNTGQEFQIDNDTSTSDRLGSGSITVATVVPAILALNNAKVAAEDNGALGYPPVNYTPGQKPDIIAITLGLDKFKESTVPDPEVLRKDEIVETWFDVITYTNYGSNSIFLRREEFASVSCICNLKAASGSGADGRLPTIWNGAEYVEGAKVGKPYGVGASNQQSQYCDVCCQDHHDTGSGNDSYRPKASSFSGDHKHYDRDNKGVLTEVGVGKDYVEACRLVRKDGFFRVAQDFDLNSQYTFPEDYLDTTDETDEYSDYVTDLVEAHFTGVAAPTNNLSHKGKDVTDPTDLPTTWSGASSQQLRSRGIYIDVASAELQANLFNCFDPLGDRSQCDAPNAQSELELYPFFDVQLTKLARWPDMTGGGSPFTVSDEELQTDNTHSRGVAKLAGTMDGESTARSKIDTGNTGLISMAPITLQPATAYSDADIYVRAGTGSGGGSTGTVVSGSITNAGGTGTLVPSVSGTGATCGHVTNTTFSCTIDPFPTLTPTITISNYYKNAQTNLIACANSFLTYDTHNNGTSASTNWTRFILPATATGGVTITIVKGTSCP